MIKFPRNIRNLFLIGNQFTAELSKERHRETKRGRETKRETERQTQRGGRQREIETFVRQTKNSIFWTNLTYCTFCHNRPIRIEMSNTIINHKRLN